MFRYLRTCILRWGESRQRILHKYQVETISVHTSRAKFCLSSYSGAGGRTGGEEELSSSRLCSLSLRRLLSASQIQTVCASRSPVGRFIPHVTQHNDLTSWELPDFLCHVKNHCALPKKMLKRDTSGGAAAGNYDCGIWSDHIQLLKHPLQCMARCSTEEVDWFDLKNLPSQSHGVQDHSPGLTPVALKKKFPSIKCHWFRAMPRQSDSVRVWLGTQTQAACSCRTVNF